VSKLTKIGIVFVGAKLMTYISHLFYSLIDNRMFSNSIFAQVMAKVMSQVMSLAMIYLVSSSTTLCAANTLFRMDTSKNTKLRSERNFQNLEELAGYLFYRLAPKALVELKRLNPELTNHSQISAGVLFLAPMAQYRIQRGDTLREIGALLLTGGANAYEELLKINPELKNPDLIHSGHWLNIPRIPSEKDRWELSKKWARNFSTVAMVAPRVVHTQKFDQESSKQRESFLPQNLVEAVSLFEWYVQHLGEAEGRERLDQMASELEMFIQSHSKNKWEHSYPLASYYFKTGRNDKVLSVLEKIIEEKQISVQVAFLYLMAKKKAGRVVSSIEQDSFYQRFPALEHLFKSENNPQNNPQNNLQAQLQTQPQAQQQRSEE